MSSIQAASIAVNLMRKAVELAAKWAATPTMPTVGPRLGQPAVTPTAGVRSVTPRFHGEHDDCEGEASCDNEDCVWECAPHHPTDHRPYCGAIGSKSEGWYWGDTNELIAWENCAKMKEPTCGAIGTRSEGWYSDNGLIAWDFCHRLVGVALRGETCTGTDEMVCHTYLYCQGADPASGKEGICRDYGRG